MVDASISIQINSILNRKIPAANLTELNAVCQEFPCFSSAYILKAIYEKKENEETFQRNLPSIATRVNNRSILYDRVHNDFEKRNSAVSEKIANPFQQGDEEVEELLHNAEQLQEDTSTKDVDLPIFDESANLKDLATSINKKAKGRKKKEAPKTEAFEVEKVILKEKVTKKAKKKAVKKKTNSIENKPKSFTDWLKNKKSLEPKKVTISKEKIPEILEEIPLDLAVSNEAELILEARKSPLKLEDFIVNQIEIKQNRRAHLASNFTHAVSETYAEILSNQGKNMEAITIYKELSVKYPEKSSSFARQIEKLKNSI